MSAENSCVYVHYAKRTEKDFAALDLKYRGQIGITIIRMWQNDNAATSTAVSCGLHHHDIRRSRGIASGCPMDVELVHLRSRKRFPHSPYFCSCSIGRRMLSSIRRSLWSTLCLFRHDVVRKQLLDGVRQVSRQGTHLTDKGLRSMRY